MHPRVHARTQPDKAALVMADCGQRLSYAELDARANQVAQLLRARGLKAGDHIALLLENQLRFFELCWGAQRAGIIYTAMSTRLKVAEAAYILDNCQARLLVSSQALAAQASELLGQMPSVHTCLMLDGTVPGFGSYEAALAAQPATPIGD